MAPDLILGWVWVIWVRSLETRVIGVRTGWEIDVATKRREYGAKSTNEADPLLFWFRIFWKGRFGLYVVILVVAGSFASCTGWKGGPTSITPILLCGCIWYSSTRGSHCTRLFKSRSIKLYKLASRLSVRIYKWQSLYWLSARPGVRLRNEAP